MTTEDLSTAMKQAIATVAEIVGVEAELVTVFFSVNGWSIHINGPKGFQTNEMETLDKAVEDALVIARCL